MNTPKYDLPKGFIFILAMLTSITPLAIDVYLPSFKQIANQFYTSIDQIEITLSIYLLGFALGQLLGGTLSDRYGRKIFIFGGLSVYILCSIFISLASTVEQLWVFRFFQAIGGGFAVVNTSAIVRDVYHGKEAAKIFSVISMIIMVAPLLAPVIGVVILHFFSWNYIFIFLSIYALILLYFITKLPETSPKIKKGGLFSNYIVIFKNPNAILLILANGFGFSGLFIFITKASFIYMEHFSLDTTYFSVFFGFNVASLIMFSRLNIKLLEKYSSMRLFIVGITLQFVTAVTLFALSPVVTLPVVVIGFMIFIGALGFVFGNSISLLLEHFQEMSATATALNGVVGFIISAFVGFLASYFHDGTLQPIFILMMATSFLSLNILGLLLKRKRYT
ncbi:MAG: multidrug effflux MFS transporter [Sulfurimonas sp.]|jgi:DHA1 family bicyclomycin/chloramphenicol resistance-like MFS transporter|nr:multidrug effflux MFS transporter [Sulfurimonas sp.]